MYVHELIWSLDSDLVTLCEQKLSTEGLDSINNNLSPKILTKYFVEQKCSNSVDEQW